MASVYRRGSRDQPEGETTPEPRPASSAASGWLLGPFLRASSLHLGAAAAASSLRHELVANGSLDRADFDAAYAIARLTPGTNLLALYALLGHRLGGWRLTLAAVAVGIMLPSTVAVLIAILYSQNASPVVALIMRGARAGGVAVFLGAVVRLIRPQLTEHRRLGITFAVVAFAVVWCLPINQLFVLLVAGGLGAVILKPTR
jgi:chromate transporter